MAIWSGSLSDFAAGEEPTAAKMQTQVDALHGLTDAETSWTPQLRYGSTLWTVGNATVDATYRRSGKLSWVTARWVFGSSSAVAGSGQLSIFNLPVTARRAATAFPCGTAFITDISGPADYLCFVFVDSDGSLAFIRSDTGGKFVSGGTPFTWASGDSIRFSVQFEAA